MIQINFPTYLTNARNLTFEWHVLANEGFFEVAIFENQ